MIVMQFVYNKRKMLPNLSVLSIKDRSIHRVIILGIVAFLSINLAWVFWGHTSVQDRYFSGNLFQVVVRLAATGLAFEVRRRLNKKKQPGLGQIQIWNWLCIGLAIWVIGDITRLFLVDLTTRSEAWYKTLDLIYLNGSLAMFIGLILMPRKSRINVGPVRLMLDMTISSAAVITMAWLSIFEPAYYDLFAGYGIHIAILYPVVDLLLLLTLVNLFLMTEPGSLAVSYGWIGVALVLFVVSDLAYVYLIVAGESPFRGILSYGWALGDCMIALAAIYYIENGEKRGTIGPFRQKTSYSLQSLTPLSLTILMGLLSVLNWQFGSQFEQLGLWVTAVLGIGLVARQGILAGEVEFQQYANLVNSVAEPTFICDRRGRLRLVNPALLSALGVDNNATISQPLSKILTLTQDVSEIINHALAQGWSGEGNLMRADGTTIAVRLALRPISSGNDSNLALAGTAHDLSEYKQQQAVIQLAYEQVARAREELELLNTQLEEKVVEKTASLSDAYEQLEAQNRKLQSLDQMKSDFVSLVSHELRAPLTNISAGIELVMSQPSPLPRRAYSTLDLVQAEIQRLTRFVETILDISALEAGKTPIYPAPTYLESIILLLKNQMRHLPNAARVQWHIPKDIPFFLADEQALNSILFHLLDNAMKYAPDGDIIVSAGSQATRGWIQVSDEGPGIAEDAIPYLFTRFYRSRASDSQTVYGHGLGLYIVHRLIDAMHGEIQVINRPQGGASFTCWLPIVNQADQSVFEEA